MALKGWRGKGCVRYASTPYGRQLIESEYAKKIMSGQYDDPKKAEELAKEIMQADLKDEVIANLILNLGIRQT